MTDTDTLRSTWLARVAGKPASVEAAHTRLRALEAVEFLDS